MVVTVDDGCVMCDLSYRHVSCAVASLLVLLLQVQGHDGEHGGPPDHRDVPGAGSALQPFRGPEDRPGGPVGA